VPSPSGTVYLPFIAPMKCVSTIRFEKEISKRIHGFFCSPEIEFVAAQNHTAMFEKATSDYYLIHFNTGFVFPLHHHNVKVDIACRNLLNRAYFDYLSRLKNYGIYNTGINFALSLSTDLNIH
jgi:iron complex outermembrane receptor protein